MGKPATCTAKGAFETPEVQYSPFDRDASGRTVHGRSLLGIHARIISTIDATGLCQASDTDGRKAVCPHAAHEK